jgi:hypothetical protein
MTYRFLTDLGKVLRDAGLDVVEIPGWSSRGRPASTGSFDPRGNLWHHTGGPADGLEYARWLALVGRSDLPAPLCQVSVGRDGTMYLCAAGRANHAGSAKAAGPVPGGDGNALYLGWECQNTGGEGWSTAQYDAMVTAAAATSKHYGWAAVANRAHRETSLTGKWDPGLLDMDKFRADIADRMEGDPMADYEAQLKRIEDKVDAGNAADKASRERAGIRYHKVRDVLKRLETEVKDDATKAQVRDALAALGDEPTA